MKICKLKLKNLNSFRQEVDLDFESSPLDDASLVAITGPTGSGKTTLLDAICVALYDKTPRLSGTGSQNPNYLISHGEKEGFAEVHFIANNIRYIATWSAKQGSPRKGQLRYADGDKLISDKLSSRGKSLGSNQNTISEEVMAILGLDFDAFRRSVMLAQGEFAAFLKAKQEDRRQILEATAGIGIYEILKDTLNKKISEVEAANVNVLAKLDKIPEASQEQLAGAKTEFGRLQKEADALEGEIRQVQSEKQREVERKEDFGKLQVSEDRQDELSNRQPEIDALQSERESAERAKDLRSEKREYDAAKSDFENAENALDTATIAKTKAEDQVKVDQTDFDEKEDAYQTASVEHKEKTRIYTDAKLDVERASDQFAKADNLSSKLTKLDDGIDTLSGQLTDSETEQTELQKQIKDARTFLNENRLPSDRQHRLTQANVLSTKLDSQQQQLKTALTSEAAHGEQVSSLEREIEKLSKVRVERLSEKTEAEATLKSAEAELDKLQVAGSQDEWNTQKQQAVKAQPIAQKYETAENDLTDTEERLNELNEEKARLDTELEQIEVELVRQAMVCRHAEKAVEHCEETRESALLANPINQLRQRLQPGEPCSVCGATHHPRAHVLESEDDDLLRNAEDALEQAKTKLQTAQEQIKFLNTKQTEAQRDTHNTTIQIEDDESRIEALRDEKAKRLAEWQEIYPNDGVSCEWVAAQIEEADIAMADLAEAEQARTEASHTYEIVLQYLETCETDITREKESLSEAKKQLQNANEAIEDWQADLASTEKRFWEYLPEAFHGVEPKVALDQFSRKIDEVEERENELNGAKIQIKLIDAKIETDQSRLENLRNNRDDLQDAIDEYRREGEVFLDSVREKTGGLKTEDEIDAAIDAIVADLQAKETERDNAQWQLQESINLFTQKQTAHAISEKHREECNEKFETARAAYFDKLSDAGFDSPKVHNDAFRDDVQLQELTNRIDVHEDEKQRLVLDITRLRTRFEETPYDPEALARIETEAEEIGRQLEAAQQEVGAQQQRIENVKDALEKREALGDEIAAAGAELVRWKNLQDTIPRNELRDFALEIMFKQMGSLANEQLKYLTSERYQLKVESIGDLSVIDRWNANEERPVETLSGGESFLTSLALALALADLSRGRAQLNSLFLDEGFGTLDAETLDIAIAALEGLRVQGRSIFLISHVQELTRRLPVKINVRKRGNGTSYVHPEG